MTKYETYLHTCLTTGKRDLSLFDTDVVVGSDTADTPTLYRVMTGYSDDFRRILVWGKSRSNAAGNAVRAGYRMVRIQDIAEAFGTV